MWKREVCKIVGKGTINLKRRYDIALNLDICPGNVDMVLQLSKEG